MRRSATFPSCPSCHFQQVECERGFFWRLTIQFSRRYKLDECSTLFWPAVCSELQKMYKTGQLSVARRLFPTQETKTKTFLCHWEMFFCLHSDLLPLLLPASIAVVIHRYILSTRQIDQEGRKRGLKRNFFLHFRQINVSVFFSNVGCGGGRCRSFRPRPIRLACKASHTSPFSQKSRLSRVGSHLVMEFANQ